MCECVRVNGRVFGRVRVGARDKELMVCVRERKREILSERGGESEREQERECVRGVGVSMRK